MALGCHQAAQERTLIGLGILLPEIESIVPVHETKPLTMRPKTEVDGNDVGLRLVLGGRCTS
jgi:hypothetical protein